MRRMHPVSIALLAYLIFTAGCEVCKNMSTTSGVIEMAKPPHSAKDSLFSHDAQGVFVDEQVTAAEWTRAAQQEIISDGGAW